MFKKNILASVVMMAAIATSSVVYSADATTAKPMSPEQQKQIENVVHNYLVKNPEVLVESLQVLQKKQMEQARKTMHKTEETAPKYAEVLFHQAGDPMAGNASGKVTVVEFFDYQCSHCVDMAPVIDALIKADPNVRVVFKEFPIRGPLSEYAAKAALAASAQGKYFEFHKALMDQISQKQPLTEDSILKAAQKVGLNMDKLKSDMNSDDIKQKIKANYKLAQDLQLLGTPAFFIAKSDIKNNAAPTAIAFIPGQIDQGQLKAMITKVGQ